MRRGILATRDELHQLRDRIGRKPFDSIYDFLKRRCNLILGTPPTTEAQWRIFAQQGSSSAALLAARSAQGRIMDLTIAHHVDANTAYRDRALEELKSLLSWSTWVDPSSGSSTFDLCTAEAGVAAIIGLDWLYEDMTEPDRLRVLHAVRHRVVEAYHKAVAGGAWWYNVYHASNAVTGSGALIAALALSDEYPIAREVYRLAMAGLKNFFAVLGREGGWDEGTGYWGYAMRYVLLAGEAADRLLDDRSIFRARGMDNTAHFPIYFTPNGQPASFGDMPTVPLLGTMYLLVKHYGVRELTWWLDTYAFHRDVTTTDYSAAGLALLMRPTDAEVPLSPDLRPLKAFNEIGWAAMADHWPRPTLYVAAKAGDLAAHHSQHDMNSIQLQHHGEMLLTDLGHAPYSREEVSDERESFYEVQAQAHNTLTVAGADHRIDAQGTIVEAQVGRNYRWLALDGGVALGEMTHFIRHIVMQVNPATQQGLAVLVLDELQMPSPATVDLYWHSQGQIQLAQAGSGGAGGSSGAITGSAGRLFFALGASSGVKLAVSQRPISGGKTDRILHATVAGASKLYIASLFSTAPVAGPVVIKRNHGGEFKVRCGQHEVYFKGVRRYLQLDKVME